MKDERGETFFVLCFPPNLDLTMSTLYCPLRPFQDPSFFSHKSDLYIICPSKHLVVGMSHLSIYSTSYFGSKNTFQPCVSLSPLHFQQRHNLLAYFFSPFYFGCRFISILEPRTWNLEP